MKYLLSLLCLCSSAFGANSVSLQCIAPTTRTDGSTLPSTDLGPYTFFLDGQSIGTSTSCALIYPIKQGTTITKTQVFTVQASDKNGVKSPLSAGVSLSSDASNPFPPSAPTLLIITTAP